MANRISMTCPRCGRRSNVVSKNVRKLRYNACGHVVTIDGEYVGSELGDFFSNEGDGLVRKTRTDHGEKPQQP